MADEMQKFAEFAWNSVFGGFVRLVMASERPCSEIENGGSSMSDKNANIE